MVGEGAAGGAVAAVAAAAEDSHGNGGDAPAEPGHRHDAVRHDALARLARRVEAPFISEHIAFVRAGGMESGHLPPLPRTRAALDALVENVHVA